MLSLLGKAVRHCDGISRRSFLSAGLATLGGMTLADLLRAEAAAGIRSSRKSLLILHLDGGPPQMDMWDLKPNAPAEIRGEFAPVATNVPGIELCELLPKLATISDRCAFVRSLVGSAGAHNAFQCQSGYPDKDLKSLGGRPAVGSVLSKLWGSPEDVAPTFVDLMQGRALVRNSARAGFLGPSYQPFRPDMSKLFARPLERGMMSELARLGGDHTVSLTLDPSLSRDRLDTRTQLLASLDGLRRQVDGSGMMDAMDRFTQQAVSILTSGQFAEAMDLSREDPRMLARYTGPSGRGTQSTTSEGPEAARKLLLARRLLEAGVRCVSVSLSDFDTHRTNFPRLKHLLPIVDHALYAFITDLEERGMLDDVTIVAWGEFGRTPRVNSKGGRDHWPRVGPAFLAGGGIKGGQVIGETDRFAAEVKSRPVHYKEVIATMYHNLGIDPHAVTLADPTGRPQYLLDDGQPIREVL